MPRALTALFSSRASAKATRDRLVDIGIPANEIDIQDQDAYAGGQSTGGHKGFVDSLKGMFGAHEDHHAYAEGLTRGQVLLTATVQDNETDRAIQVLEGSDAIDLDRQESEWRTAGWTGASTAGAMTADRSSGATDDVIQVAEERLVVGKREVERGGVRVRSYIVSTPVSEQVTLREETVGIERRPVNRAVGAGDDAFRDRSIEVLATGEEAVVGKQAVVTEEIAVRKDVGQRTEEVRDTVRRTEVDVERVEGGVAQTTPTQRV
ncbi:YsnF/AvaK domain-containing protein [Caulobacter sp. S45]|uniref:YsnF/AvaK domain-containing protein n=1 Tax=Caulobacter sp. S45 TaxID=1641861 RepID=UPI001575CF95|nr:YsnF/AvaK domain-containing protein [Caulobacter sp. S45]